MPTNDFLQQKQNIADRELPAVFTPRTGHSDFKLHALPDDVDQDQRVSQQLLGMPMDFLPSVSAPEPFMDNFFMSSPTSDADSASADVCLSPAAMFLSSFSPMVAPQALPDDEGEVVSGYVLGPVIGRGGFSTIRRASSTMGGVVAVKIVRRADLDKQDDSARARSQLQQEAAVWASLSHEHILPLFSSTHTSYADFFVTLYCPAGSLFDILKRDGQPALPQDEAGRMYRQVVKGLRYMHEVAGYVHGDMKLENVLVDEMGVCRIADFGMAKRIGECESDDEDRPSRTKVARHTSISVRPKRSRSRHPLQHVLPSHPSLLAHQSGPRHRISSPFPTNAPSAPHHIFQPGSLPYASPELLMPSTSAAPYHAHPAQDIWALGVMLYVMLTGRLPFADSFEPRLQMKILNGAFTMPSDIGRGAERVLRGSLEHSVHDRWTIAMVDEVAWGIGWGDAGDNTPPPLQVPQSVDRSRSRARPTTVPEDKILSDNAGINDAQRPRLLKADRRSRSSRSRSRHTAYHPYNINAHGHDEEWDHAITRTISSSTDGEGLSPVDNMEIRTPSSSLGRGSRERSHRVQTVSLSRSPPEAHISAIEAVMHDRGRKMSPRYRGTLLSSSDSPLSPMHALDTMSDSSGPGSYVDEAPINNNPRSISVDRHTRQSRSQIINQRNRSLDKHHRLREISMPSRDDRHGQWPGTGKDALGFITFARRDRMVTPRSRSVDASNTAVL